MTLGNLMKGLMQSASGSQQGGDPLTQALGGSSGDMMLSALEGIIGGQPGSVQSLMHKRGAIPNTGGTPNNPAMGMIEPVANQVATRAHISPAVATIVAAVAMHYLLASHPSTQAKAPMDFGSAMQELQLGGLSQNTMQNSGMLSDLKQATGLNDQQAHSGLDAAFKALASHL